MPNHHSGILFTLVAIVAYLIIRKNSEKYDWGGAGRLAAAAAQQRAQAAAQQAAANQAAAQQRAVAKAASWRRR